ncbi:MAG TPA: Flp family type IVb pilin [Thermoguttaceae bacterium]|nr:Flp family type IVb pilin [Thermoguttaceae bacterium]
MSRFIKKIVRFLASEEGPTAVEYAMVLMLIFMVCLSAITLIGQATSGNFEASSSSIQKAYDARP